MKKVENILYREKNEVEEVIIQAKSRLKSAPEGHIRIAKKGNEIEFYFKSKDDKKGGKYLKKEKIKLAKAIVQRDYDKKLLKKADKRLKILDRFLKDYEETDLEMIYERTNGYRRELLSEHVVSDEEYARLWEEVIYQGKEFDENQPVFITEKGERVRSKSEKIIADKLYMLGIPYRYEFPLVLEGRIKIYPDFTILKINTREEIYLEHLGMMDDVNYVANTVRKLGTYERNGIFLGVNLLLTYENGKSPLNTKNLDNMLRKVFEL